MTPEEAMQHPWISERAWKPDSVSLATLRRAISRHCWRAGGATPCAFDKVCNRLSNHASRHRQKQKQQQQQQDKRERKSSETTTTAATTANGAAATAEPVNPTAASNAPVDDANVELDKDTLKTL
uniref:Protein kinase domain-containing protein n=1 Tax=Macrostomum lignano TaxID=282301 RepID=A0A1I8IZV0_9PLAT